MRLIFSLLAFAALLRAEPLELQPGCVVELAEAATAAKLLSTEDAYLRRMSPFDREFRMRTSDTPSVPGFASHCAAHARDFTDAERATIRSAVEKIGAVIAPWKLPFPSRISVLKTDGAEDINAPYSRGPVIVIPEAKLKGSIERMFAHELFHVFSNGHPERRAAFYALLGYKPCTELALPPAQDRRRFTNPDAMDFRFHLPLTVDGRNFSVIPMLLAKHDHFDAAHGSVWKQVDLVLAEVRVIEGKCEPVLDAEGRAVTHEPMPAFLRAMARNTQYILHPEEVLADNFMHAVFPPKELKYPELPAKLVELMK